MCLLLVMHRVVPGHPVVVAANRDEAYGRPSGPPELLHGTRPGEADIVAPRDALAGGTWIGVNSAGLFVGMTNRPAGTPDPSRRSRGLLALDILRETSAEAASRSLALSLEAEVYNPFNMIWSDGRNARAVHYEGEAREQVLLPGVHVLSNLHDLNKIFVTEILREFDPISAARRLDGKGLLDHLAGICRNHDVRTPQGHAICKHFETRGTVSSTILRIPPGRCAGGILLHAPGPPCTTDYIDYSRLLKTARGRAAS
jgi:hypothetical protein